MRLFASVAGLSLAVATSVFAQTASEQPAGQAAQAGASAPAAVAPSADTKKDGVICRKETPTGSHFPVKVCTTAEQRKSQRGVAQHAQESMQAPTPTIPN